MLKIEEAIQMDLKATKKQNPKKMYHLRPEIVPPSPNYVKKQPRKLKEKTQRSFPGKQPGKLKDKKQKSIPANESNFQWYWKNRRLKIWEEFDQENKSKLNNKYLKRKTFAHVLVDGVWHQVTFQDKTMQKINTSSKTVVERATRKPDFKEEGTDGDFDDNFLDKDQVQRKTIYYCQGCGCRMNHFSENKTPEINAKRNKMNENEISRTDADGSDEGGENESLRQPTSKTKSENSSNQKRNIVGVCRTAVRDDDHFPSDDDDDNDDDDDDDRKTGEDKQNRRSWKKWSREKQRKGGGGNYHSADFKHGPEGRKHEEYPDTKTPSTKQQEYVRSTSGDAQKV
ncbi:transcription initiation factor TFIID subunit 11-like [Argopecten irradians]|uniref:transcription initiation factor TFIID subunit 11-like n=1 Tax=Argopecten irradians TaxID=31199 RepID=UPI003710056A